MSRKIISRPGIIAIVIGVALKVLSLLIQKIPILGKIGGALTLPSKIFIIVGIALIIINLLVGLLSKIIKKQRMKKQQRIAAANSVASQQQSESVMHVNSNQTNNMDVF